MEKHVLAALRYQSLLHPIRLLISAGVREGPLIFSNMHFKVTVPAEGQ